MTIYDISHYGIRVVLDEGVYDAPTPTLPHQIEGTVIQLMTHGAMAEKMYRQGRVIDLLCNYDYEGAADGYVRWDNDKRIWLTGGTMYLRSAKFGHIKSIWEDDRINYDDTPFHELQPATQRPKPKYFWETKQAIKAVPPPSVTWEAPDEHGNVRCTDESGNVFVVNTTQQHFEIGISEPAGEPGYIDNAVVNAEIPPKWKSIEVPPDEIVDIDEIP